MTDSLWLETSIPSFPKLTRDQAADVVIVGGGIFGLTSAYLLSQAGKKVVLLERDSLASGDTACTSAHLTIVPDIHAHDLESRFGKDTGALVYQGHASAIDTIEHIVRTENLRCGFTRTPAFLLTSFLNSDEKSAEILKAESEALSMMEIPHTFLKSAPVFKSPAIRFPDQALFHPRQYLAGLAEILQQRGCLIFENSEVVEFKEKPFGVVANGNEVKCDYIIVATHIPLTGARSVMKAAMFQTKLASYSSYVIGAKVPKNVFPHALCWDVSDPYYYLRTHTIGEQDYAILGGNDHKTGQEQDPIECYEDLVKLLMQFTPEASVDHQWSGQVVETPDGLPYIGEYGENQFTGTGFSGNGLTYGTLSAMMACDAVLGRENPWQELFSPERKPIRSAWSYLKENVDYPYYLIKDRLFQIRARTTEKVKVNEGKIVRMDGKDLACYRDQDGTLFKCTAVCPHMGCLVRWNEAETTWDCPCHGSRFKYTGELIAGPAEEGLEKV